MGRSVSNFKGVGGRGDHHHPQSSPECNDRPAGSLRTPLIFSIGQNTNSIAHSNPKLKEIHREMNDSAAMLQKLVQFEFWGMGDHHQGSRPVRIFFAATGFCFRGPNFRTGCPGIWQAREKKIRTAIPAAGPGLTQPCPDLFFAEREKNPDRPHTGRPQAGGAGPIRDSL